MIENKEYIEALLFEKITGTISDEDNLVIENAMLHSLETRVLWQELQHKMSQPQASNFLSGLDPDRAWERTTSRMEEKPRPFFKQSVWHAVGIAAMLTLLIPLAWRFFSQPAVPKKESQLYAAKEIYLKMDGGEVVEMAKPQQVTVGAAKLNTTADEMSYHAGSEAAGSWATLVVPNTKDYKITLSDGTVVWMNAASSLRFPFSFGTQSREVYLKGEAYFNVAKNPNQAFIVHTDHADIRVHGTIFNVSAYDESNFSTALVEGSVSAVKQGQALQLKPGQKAMISNNQLDRREFDPSEELAWMRGIYTFHNQSLAEIAPVISRWFDVKVDWAQADVAKQTFTGEIDKSLPLAVVLSNLRLASGIRADIKNGVLTFK